MVHDSGWIIICISSAKRIRQQSSYELNYGSNGNQEFERFQENHRDDGPPAGQQKGAQHQHCALPYAKTGGEAAGFRLA